VIVRFDGKTILQPADLQRAASDTPPGKTVDVGILRAGAHTTLHLTVGTAPAGAECWESYNAALRALRLGYREVYWYRGGVASWQAAGLPLYPP